VKFAKQKVDGKAMTFRPIYSLSLFSFSCHL